MSWRASGRHPGTHRTNVWTCNTNARLQVKHCGHPTANRPYFIIIDGVERMDLGTHRWLAYAQHAAEQAIANEEN